MDVETNTPEPENGGSWATADEDGVAIVDGAPVRITEHPDGTKTFEAVQPTIPGLRPPFDVAAALDSIEEAEKAASLAEREYASAAEKAKSLRKIADAENDKLRALIRGLNERRHDARYEPNAESEVMPSESSEMHLPRDGDDQHVSGASATEAPATETSEPSDDMPPATLKELLSKAGADITQEQINEWTWDQKYSARDWGYAQLDANAKSANGQHVSVAWPAHVSEAHHGPAAQRYPKRKKRA